MTKKEEKMESCSCENCKCWGGRILGVGLSGLWVIISIITCLIACGALVFSQRASDFSKAVYDFNVLSAGWEENFNRMNEVYKSEAYVEYATQQAEQAESYFASAWDDTTVSGDTATPDETDIAEEDASNIVAWGDEVKSLVTDMLASSPIRGDENARFTIVEYTELLCPFCQRHSTEGTINSVIEQFPGEVNSISKSFIIHGEEALKLSSAMECIAELKSDVYHETFEKAFEAYPVDMDGLIGIATWLGVDEAALKACVDEGKYTQAVNDGMTQASSLFGVNGTPGNVIIDKETGNYIVVSGAYPVSEFVNAINELKNA